MHPLAPFAILVYSLLATAGEGAHATRHCVDLHPLTHRFTILDSLLVTTANVTCPAAHNSVPTLQHQRLLAAPSEHNFSFSFHGTGVRVLGASRIRVDRVDRPRPELVHEGRNEALGLHLAPYLVSGTGAIEGVHIYTYTQGLTATYTPQAGIFCNHTSFHGYLSGRWAAQMLPRDVQSRLANHPYIVPKSGDAVAHLLPPPGSTYIEVVTIGPGPFSVDITPPPLGWGPKKGYAPCELPSTAVVWSLDPEVHYEVAVVGALVGAKVWATPHKPEDYRLWYYDRKQDDTDHEKPEAGQNRGLGMAHAVILAVVFTLLIGVPIGVAIGTVVRWHPAAEKLMKWVRERQEHRREGRVKLPDPDPGQPVIEPVD